MAHRSTLKNIHNLIKSSTDQISAEASFLNDVSFAITKSEKPRKASQSYKPSSFHCLRNMYYQIMGIEADVKPVDEYLINVGDIGTHRHETLQGIISTMDKLGIDCEWVDVEKWVAENCKGLGTVVVKKDGFEYKCKNTKLNLSFKCDGIIKYKGEYYILEIKTEGSYTFNSRKGIKPDHEEQASCYSHCFNIFKVLFVYESRDNCARKAYIFQTNKTKNHERVVDKIDKCNYYVDKQIPPPCTEDKRVCQYCSYVGTCKKDG